MKFHAARAFHHVIQRYVFHRFHIALPAVNKTAEGGGGSKILDGAGRIRHTAQAGQQCFPGGGHFGFGNVSFPAGIQLLSDFLPGDSFLVKIDARVYKQDTLGPVVGGIDGVAQAHFLPDVLEQLTGHAAAENHVKHLHGGKLRTAVGNGGAEAHAQLALSYIQRLGDITALSCRESSLGRQCHRVPVQCGQKRLQGGNDLLPGRAAHIEQLHGAGA